MVYRLVCSLVYGICIASSGYAAAQSSEIVKEEPAVQTEEPLPIRSHQTRRS